MRCQHKTTFVGPEPWVERCTAAATTERLVPVSGRIVTQEVLVLCTEHAARLDLFNAA